MASLATRRSTIRRLLAGSAVLASGATNLSLAGGLVAASGDGARSANDATQARLVFVILRGGMDGLSAVPAYGDPEFANARRDLAIARPGVAGGALDLDGFFGLNPRLVNLHGLYHDGQMLVVHAVCSPYRARSHFDGQNVLECGAPVPFGLDSGWLNRALEPLTIAGARAETRLQQPPDGMALHGMAGIALSSAVPLVLRGNVPVTSWAPSHFPSPQADLIARVNAMYSQDVLLANAFMEAQATHGLMDDVRGPNGIAEMLHAAGTFLTAVAGPRVAVLESTGWDSHATQAQPLGGLYRNLGLLDRGIGQLQNALGPRWGNTVVIIASEFGRTVAMNGTAGTDHGTGGAMFLLGGAVQGKRVIADWPGLAVGQRFEGRDLRTTMDMRSVLKGVLHDHLQVADAQLEARVFPGSGSAKRLQGLLRSA